MVAALLGKHWTTIARRESGEITFDREMWLALCSLPLRKQRAVKKYSDAAEGSRMALEAEHESDDGVGVDEPEG